MKVEDRLQCGGLTRLAREPTRVRGPVEEGSCTGERTQLLNERALLRCPDAAVPIEGDVVVGKVRGIQDQQSRFLQSQPALGKRMRRVEVSDQFRGHRDQEVKDR